MPDISPSDLSAAWPSIQAVLRIFYDFAVREKAADVEDIEDAWDALPVEIREAVKQQEKCKHEAWKGLAKSGRCCPTCHEFLVDCGD